MRREVPTDMPAIPVSQIMSTRPRTIHADDSVVIADWLLTLDHIHHVVVVDADEKVIGIVSDRDLLRAFGGRAMADLPVAAIMTKHVQTISPTAPASEAIERMQRGKFHALPVSDDLGHLVGIITTSDFLDVARWALGVERTTESRPAL
jgi:CBS domain-containing protein